MGNIMAKLFSFKNDVAEPYVNYPETTIAGDASAVEYIAEWDGRLYYTSPDSFNTESHTMHEDLDYQYHESLSADISRTLISLKGLDPDDEDKYIEYGLTFDILADDLSDNDPGLEPAPNMDPEEE
jgi:hypothetical protein